MQHNAATHTMTQQNAITNAIMQHNTKSNVIMQLSESAQLQKSKQIQYAFPPTQALTLYAQ